jgi:hypothetical protein
MASSRWRRMARICPRCHSKVGQVAEKCWNCGGSLDSRLYGKAAVYADAGGPGLVAAGVLMILAGLFLLFFIITSSAISDSYGITYLDIAVPLGLIAGILSILRISYKVTLTLVLISGIFIAIRFGLHLLNPAWYFLLSSLVCVLIAASLIGSNRNRFRI